MVRAAEAQLQAVPGVAKFSAEAVAQRRVQARRDVLSEIDRGRWGDEADTCLLDECRSSLCEFQVPELFEQLVWRHTCAGQLPAR